MFIQEDFLGKVIIYEDSFEIFLYNKESNDQSRVVRSIFITDFILNKNSFRHHFVALEDILNLKQFAVIKDE